MLFRLGLRPGPVGGSYSSFSDPLVKFAVEENRNKEEGREEGKKGRKAKEKRERPSDGCAPNL